MRSEKNFPRYFLDGPDYYTFLALLMTKFQPNSYFEIGVFKGKSLRNAECATVGVDPNFSLRGLDIVGKKPSLHLFQMESDSFFEKKNLFDYFENGIDLAFLDGMHLFEYLLRDFINAEKYSHTHSLYLMHDCLPINAEMTERQANKAARKDVELASHWTGDVWKLVPILQKYRPDLTINILDCTPTGLVALSNLDSNNTILKDNYESIVAEFMSVEMTDATIGDFRNGLTICPAKLFLEQIQGRAK